MQTIIKNTFRFIFTCSAQAMTTLFLMLILLLCSCKKFIEVGGPVTSMNVGNVYTSDATAAAVMTGIYSKMSDLNFDLGLADVTGISLYSALSADELSLYNVNDSRLSPFYRNDLKSSTQSGNFWSSIYPVVFVANSAIEGLNKSKTLTANVKQQLLGEAKFIRAFCYFYLVNLYGDVPLAITSDPEVNRLLSRTSKMKVYEQIVDDLKEAQNLLSNSYLKSDALSTYSISSAERVRPTKWSATALLSRVYLYLGDWTNAEAQASAVINNSSYFNLSLLANTFLKNSSETIWSLQPVRDGTQSNTGEGSLFILPITGPNTSDHPVYLSNNVINSFEQGDLRKMNWTDSVRVGTTTYYYPYKYKIGNASTGTQEYIMVLRLAEQYLVRAEARARLNNISGCKTDLNSIRSRAGLSNTTANDQSSLLTAILHERQVELFTEWGQRWLDLKRTNTIDAVMGIITPQKGGTWSGYKALYPIPQSEIDKNPNLVQNSGY